MRRRPTVDCETCGDARSVECEACDGAGSTEGAHVQNCDVGPEGGCEACLRDEECGGDGDVACPDCDPDDES